MATYKSGVLNIFSPPDEFFKYFTRKENHVSLFFAAVDLRFQVESRNSETKTVTMRILGNLISKSYKTVNAKFTVTPWQDITRTRSCLTYTFEFEKISHNTVDTKIVESLLTYIRIQDACYRREIKLSSFGVRCPPQECFKEFVNTFKDDDAYVRMESMDWQPRTFTISLINVAPLLEVSLKTIKVTTTITPKKDDNSRSRLKWTIEVEKVDDNIEESELLLIIASHVRETIINRKVHLRIEP